ncbi:hypothetical protein OAN307_c06370 [Octadecabacter antarcticus 307]|uniref:Sulfotransferase family protein n=1 Tax=Octadecabacter antarcticus 307 TaxID=391626 RepID=M9R128_9RHOB|nr:sulfotransferase family protein [Octadecabacter antarcticus]AGI66364.1 hypothetical protein OAN307_c06370 [Octadecabacter antarcticus 307]
MPRRRVIVHAGFHKTGTTSAQRFLRANGKNIWPRCSLVLPGRLRKGAARMAVRYSRYGKPALLDAFADDLHATLSKIDQTSSRKVLISDENIAGRMPGRDGQMCYSATPTLMARAEDVICDVFGTETDVVFYFTTRDPQSWIKSTYKHNLRTSRLTMDEAAYMATYAPAADLDGVTKAVAAAVTGSVCSIDLADLNGPEGPAQPLMDLIELPEHRRRKLVPHPVENAGPDDRFLADLLALNRSNLSDKALITAKADLLGKADEDDG